MDYIVEITDEIDWKKLSKYPIKNLFTSEIELDDTRYFHSNVFLK
jgi:hypothetical protein